MQVYAKSNLVFRRQFIEQNPDLSYPYVESPHIPNYMLGLLSSLVPLFALIIAGCINSCRSQTIDYFHYNSNPQPKTGTLWYLISIFSGLGISLTLNSAITNTLKILFGEPRPNMFGLCNYRGYQDALLSNNFTQYNELTKFGRFGNIEFCQAPNAEIIDAFSSFPSGHASLMFAGICYASMILAQHRLKSVCKYGLMILVNMSMIVLGLWVAYTRVMDYYHRTYDMMAGIILGSVIGYLVAQMINDIAKKMKWIENEMD